MEIARAGLMTKLVLGLATLGLVLAGHVATSGDVEAGQARCRGVIATIVGTAGADDIDGTSGRDVIVARGGADDIEAKGGNDLICAGRGNDDVEGDRGKDRIFGGAGRDDLEGNRGDDFLHGGKGFDEGEGGRGDDTCRKIEERESC